MHKSGKYMCWWVARGIEYDHSMSAVTLLACICGSKLNDSPQVLIIRVQLVPSQQSVFTKILMMDICEGKILSVFCELKVWFESIWMG